MGFIFFLSRTLYFCMFFCIFKSMTQRRPSLRWACLLSLLFSNVGNETEHEYVTLWKVLHLFETTVKMGMIFKMSDKLYIW